MEPHSLDYRFNGKIKFMDGFPSIFIYFRQMRRFEFHIIENISKIYIEFMTIFSSHDIQLGASTKSRNTIKNIHGILI